MKHILDAIKVGRTCLNALAEQGVEVEMITDFDKAESIATEIGKPGFTRKLHSAYNDFSEESAFWMFMKEDGVYTASVATRFDHVGREGMADYLSRTTRRHYPHPEADETIRAVLPGLPKDFMGSMAYIGELFMRPGHRGDRKKLRRFMTLLQVAIICKWPVDWIYAFMRDRDVHVGLATLYGFTHQIPGVVQWEEPFPEGRGSNEWLVAVPAEHLEHLMLYHGNSVEGL